MWLNIQLRRDGSCSAEGTSTPRVRLVIFPQKAQSFNKGYGILWVCLASTNEGYDVGGPSTVSNRLVKVSHILRRALHRVVLMDVT